MRRSGLIAIKLRKGDELRWVDSSSGSDEIAVVASNGQSIRFKEKDIREMGRNASGVGAIRLKLSVEVVSMDVILSNKEKKFVFTVTENGFGKISDINLYKVQRRSGSGIKTAIINAKTGKLVASRVVEESALGKDLIIISQKGQTIRIPFSSIAKSGRATQGVRIMRLSAGDRIASVSIV